MPLSFASMLGGMCTLIGTSTNLVLNAQVLTPSCARPCSSAYCLRPAAYGLLPSVPMVLPTATCSLLLPLLLLRAQIDADPDAPLQTLTMFSMSVVSLPAALAGALHTSRCCRIRVGVGARASVDSSRTRPTLTPPSSPKHHT